MYIPRSLHSSHTQSINAKDCSVAHLREHNHVQAGDAAYLRRAEAFLQEFDASVGIDLRNQMPRSVYAERVTLGEGRVCNEYQTMMDVSDPGCETY